ncbi:hypothetical protein [Neptunitalea lumnitzerae]|uniref:Uncharacterized protein n=1 Tax=Neptunitalea lumnitzerae TaxID=2965509 RepID=A0ABQ5MF07_9FLAO|nr:hypothetical protein [Neptunitalea sp. Y10]GLB47980.1 hypothetical protein Y10_03480 [Neptunitalea sp. Y10]
MKKFICTISFLFVVIANAQVGIGTTNPQGTLHIHEANGTAATATTGTIILEHGNVGGASTILFKSAVNSGNDYAYITYEDDGSGNGSTGENGLLTIGIENDSAPWSTIYQDDINIKASGSVGISNSAPNPSASLDLGANNKGLLMNRVALTSTTDVSTVNSPATGLLVYNTATTSDVTPGFYYYNGTKWVGVGAQKKYTSTYSQTAEILASTNTATYVDLPGLTQTITAPYTGTYQIIVNGYYSSGAPVNTTVTQTTSTNFAYYANTEHNHTVALYQDGASQGSIRLTINGTAIKEKYITSTSKSFQGQTFYSLGQNATIITNVTLTAGTSYTFRVQGREWARYNSNTGYFGRNTSIYVGANGVADAQYATLYINFIKE